MTTLRRAIALVAFSLVLSLAHAQPYAAGGGFDRPRELVASVQRPAVALAVDRGEAVVAYVDRGRVLHRPIGEGGAAPGRTTELASGTTFWDVIAASPPGADGDAVYAWYSRDFATGRYEYAWHTGGETRRLLESQQVLDLTLVVGPHGPEAWFARAVPSGARIERLRWRDGPDATPTSVLASDLGIAGLAVAYDASGAGHVAYLEGFTETTDFGVNAQWFARYASVAADDTGSPSPVALGAAAQPPGRVAIALEDLRVVFTTDAGRLVALAPRAAATGEPGIDLGAGRPVAATPERLFWVDGATLGTMTRPLEAGVGANAAWSPLSIERAFAERDADGVTHLVWAGRRVGGGYAILVSDDRTPMGVTIGDRVAAAFGWSPWSLAEEASGQATGALLLGVMVTMALIPLYWLLAALIVGRVPHERARLFGAALAAAVIASALALIMVVTALPVDLVLALTGLPWVALAVLLVGVLAGAFGLRKVDLESLQAVVFAACVTSFVATTLLAFATFQHWLAFLGL